jgi:hypothetical protein
LVRVGHAALGSRALGFGVDGDAAQLDAGRAHFDLDEGIVGEGWRPEGGLAGGQREADAAGVEVERFGEAAEELEVRVASGVDRGGVAGEHRLELCVWCLGEDAFARRARRPVEAEKGSAFEFEFEGGREAAQEGSVGRAELCPRPCDDRR